MSTRWRRLRDELGTLNALLYGMDRLLRGASGGQMRLVRYLLVAQPVPQSVGDTAVLSRSNGSITVRVVEADDPVVAAFPRPAAVIARRFADGATCLVAESKGRFVGFIWLAFGAYDEDEVRCRYELADPQRSVWDYDVYVAPDYRMSRAFARLWTAANAYLAERRIQWTLSRINAFNRASLDTHRRLGLVEMHCATFICLGPVQCLIQLAPGRPLFSLSVRARPLLRLGIPSVA